MNTINKKIVYILSLIIVAFVSCDDVETIELNRDANTIVSVSANSVILTEDQGDSAVLTVSWTNPDFGFDAAPSYKVLIDVAGGDFTGAQVIPAGANTEKVFAAAELNAKLLALGLSANSESTIDIAVETTLSDFQITMSEPVSMSVTPYSSLLDLSTNWGVVGSATPGSWGNDFVLDIPFFTTNETGVYVAYATLKTGEIKFRLDNDWTTNYGDDGGDGTLEQNGSNIAVTEGSYKITVDTNALTWEMESYSWGIIGSATPNDWNDPDTNMTYNSFGDDWRAVVTLGDGELKFRFDDKWDLNYGDSGADGSLDQNGDNIAVSAGHYLVIVNFNTGEYSIEAMDVWGLVGSGTANGWDGPNDKFVPDFGVNEGFYYLNGAELSDGEIKVRQNDAWGINYGDDGNDGTMELNGANIPVTAGTYNIVLDFSVTPPTISLFLWP